MCRPRTTQYKYCNSIGCPDDKVPIPEAWITHCENDVCTEAQCCLAHCSSFSCTDDYTPVPQAETVLCDNQASLSPYVSNRD